MTLWMEVTTLPYLVSNDLVQVKLQHILICHLTSQKHLLQASYDTMGWSFSLYVTTLSSLLVLDTVLVVPCF